MTAWLLTWLWQGVALAVGVAVALRCAPRLNAATKHLIWCCALVAALCWLGWNSSPHRGLNPAAGTGGQHPIYVPSAPDISHQHLASASGRPVPLVSLLRLLPGLHAVYALRDRCRPFPPNRSGASALARSEGARPPHRADDLRRGARCDRFGVPAPVHCHPACARRGADDRRARSSDPSRVRACAAAGRLVTAGADASAVGPVDSSGGAVRLARAQSRVRDGVRRMGRRAVRACRRRMPDASRTRPKRGAAWERGSVAGSRAHRPAATSSFAVSIVCSPMKGKTRRNISLAGAAAGGTVRW